jgi:hypothetical protein
MKYIFRIENKQKAAELESVRPDWTGISPVESFEKSSLLIMFLIVKIKVSHAFL